MDNELFDLCKEVYEKTGWVGYYMRWHVTDKSGDSIWVQDGEDEKVVSSVCPLYTSDYLLEKLPRLQVDKLANDKYDAAADASDLKYEMDFIETRADTPLKALLKLVIALDDAGVKL